MKTFLMRGVPHSMQMDSWWLNTARRHPTGPQPMAGDSPLWPLRAGALVGLVALADLLLWRADPGLSLAVFGMALLVTAWSLAGQRGTAGLGLAALLFLPMVERAQALSLGFWLAGLALGAAWIALCRWPGLGAVLRFVWHGPGQVLGDIGRALASRPAVGLSGGLRSAALGWSVPLGLGLLFASLLVSANPMLENWANQVAALNWFGGLSPARFFFWAGMAMLIWPFLSLAFMVQRLKLGVAAPRAPGLPALINGASVARSLILFNAVFAVQTGMDAVYLWGGAALPDGMSHAEYTHRGAYPLLATALLAGAFALVARPFTRGNPGLRAALLGWMGQTLLLVISSLTRLDLYISTYGLTHLRLAALLWMGVVAGGIALVIWQVLRDRTAGWLLQRCGFLGAATLYASCFVSFASVIARYNLTHDVRPDPLYICDLDRAALPAILTFEAQTGTRFCVQHRPYADPITDWREWGFRDWRLLGSLTRIETKAPTQWPTF